MFPLPCSFPVPFRISNADGPLDRFTADGVGLVPIDKPLEGPGDIANDDVDEEAPTPAKAEK